jgi:hypothetical protein
MTAASIKNTAETSYSTTIKNSRLELLLLFFFLFERKKITPSVSKYKMF